MVLDRKAIDRHIEHFSATTVIRVFNYIRTSTFLVERLFWVAVLVGFSSLTFWNVSQAIGNFIAEPTASQVSYVSQGVKLTNAVMCLPLSPTSLNRLYEKAIDNVIAEANMTDFIDRLRHKLDRIHQAEDGRIARLENGTIWQNLTAVHLVYLQPEQNTVDGLGENDIAFLGLCANMFLLLMQAETTTLPHAEADWTFKWKASRHLQRLHETLLHANINFPTLFRLTTEAMCVLFKVRVLATRMNADTGHATLSLHHYCKDLRYHRRVVFYGLQNSRTIVCYRLITQTLRALTFESAFDHLTLSIDPSALYKGLVDKLNPIYLYLGGSLAREQHALSASLNDKQTIEFNLETISTIADLRRRPCTTKIDDGRHQFQCDLWCRVESIVWSCDCHPLVHGLLPKFAKLPTLPSCAERLAGDVLSEKCRRALHAKSGERANCSQQCAPSCETAFFTSTNRHDSELNYLVNATTIVRLECSKLFYQKIDEFVTMDVRALVASLGGNLSLFLGASFLAIIHIVVFFVKLPFERVYRAKELTPDAMKPAATVATFGSVPNVYWQRRVAVTRRPENEWMRTVDRRLELIEYQLRRRFDARL